MEARLFLEMLLRIYGREQAAKLACERGRDGDTVAHKAARCGFFSLLLDDLIGKLGFDVDFWRPNCRLTVINQIVKHRCCQWSDSEKVMIVRLMRLSQNLFHKSSFNSTIVRLAEICQKE